MIWVMSLPVTRPKSSTFSSVESGGMAEKPSRLRKMVMGERTRCRCLVWGMRGRKMSRVRVWVHQRALRALGRRDEEGGEVGGHQEEDEQGDEAGFVGDFLAEPDGADEESANEEAGDGDGDEQRPGGGEGEVEAADEAGGRKEAEAQADGEVVEGDQREGEESPEDEGVGDAGERALADDFALAEDLPDEVADAL
jgi:hypothetical protein